MNLMEELKRKREIIMEIFKDEKIKRIEEGSIVDLFIEDSEKDEFELKIGMLTENDTNTEIMPGIANIYLESELGQMILNCAEEDMVRKDTKTITVLSVYDNLEDFVEKQKSRQLRRGVR